MIDEYLEERYPEPPLLPADPGERAAARLVVFRFDDFGDAYYAPSGEARAGADERARRRRSAALDALLAATPFLTGRAFGLADVAYLPWLLRLRDLMGVSLEPYPAVVPLARERAPSGRRSLPRSRPSPRSPHERRHAPASSPSASASRGSCCSTSAARRRVHRRRRRPVRPAARAASPAPGTWTSPCCSRRRMPTRCALVGAAEGAEVIAYCHSGAAPRWPSTCSPPRGTRRGTTSGRGTSGRATRSCPPSRARLGRCARNDARRRVEERAAERPPLLVPRREVAVGLRHDLLERLRRARRRPRRTSVEHVPLDLGVELDAPRAVAEPVRLPRGGARASSTAPVGEVEAVVVPLERRDAPREDAEDRVGGPRRSGRPSCQPDLGLPAGPTRRPPRASDELRAEADAEDGHAGARAPTR